MIFDIVGRKASPSEQLRLCLISRALLPFGQAVLYKDVNLVKYRARIYSQAYESVSQRTARGTLRVLDQCLPSLQATHADFFSSLLMDVSSPTFAGSWVREQIGNLLRFFDTSSAQCRLILPSDLLNHDLIARAIESSAFRELTLEVAAQQEPGQSWEHRKRNARDVALLTIDDGDLQCTLWNQHAEPTYVCSPGRTAQSRPLYLVGPASDRDAAVYRLLSSAAGSRIKHLEVVPQMNLRHRLPAIAHFTHVIGVSLSLEGWARNEALTTLRLLKGDVLPATVIDVILYLEHEQVLQEDLLLLLQDPGWAPAVRYLAVQFRDASGPVAPRASQISLAEGGVSRVTAFREALAERNARLAIYDGEEWTTVCDGDDSETEGDSE